MIEIFHSEGHICIGEGVYLWALLPPSLLFSFHESMVNSPFTKRETVVNFVTVSQFSLWTGGRAAEGTGLLNRRTGYTGTAGSNPAL